MPYGFCDSGIFYEVGGFREGFEGSQDWDLFLRITEKLTPEEIGHVPYVLYHWRSSKDSTATSLSTKNYVIPRSLLSVNDTLKRRKIKAIAKVDDEVNGYYGYILAFQMSRLYRFLSRLKIVLN